MARTGFDEKIAILAQEAIARHVFPSCQVGYIREGEVKVFPFGRMTYELSSQKVNADTRYDVASITKSIPTNSIILKLVEGGRLTLDERAATYLPELQNEYREDISIRHLLTYTVVPDLPKGLSRIAKDTPGRLMSSIFTTPLMTAPGESYYYTNTPAILLGIIAERICHEQLDEIANKMFFSPLKMDKTSFDGEAMGLRNVAPTEEDDRGHVRGQPHDETAWALRRQNVIAGHAGLFSTADDLLKFAQMLLNNGQLQGRRYFELETIDQMHTNQLLRLNDRTGLGWELDLGPLPPKAKDHQTFGKTGFTGCAILMDPVAKSAMIYLSNRTYPNRPMSREPIQEFRRSLASLVFG